MKFTAALIALVAAQSTTAFRAPKDATDGLYMAYVNTDGVEVHEPIESIASAIASVDRRSIMPGTSAPNVARSLNKRGTAYCGCGYYMPGGACDDATHDLENQLGDNGHTIHGGLAFYSIRGNVIAFACNPGPQDAYWNHNDAARAFTEVTNACGWYVAGTWDNYIKAGYMFTGGDFCARADSSNQHSC